MRSRILHIKYIFFFYTIRFNKTQKKLSLIFLFFSVSFLNNLIKIWSSVSHMNTLYIYYSYPLPFLPCPFQLLPTNFSQAFMSIHLFCGSLNWAWLSLTIISCDHGFGFVHWRLVEYNWKFLWNPSLKFGEEKSW